MLFLYEGTSCAHIGKFIVLNYIKMLRLFVEVLYLQTRSAGIKGLVLWMVNSEFNFLFVAS